MSTDFDPPRLQDTALSIDALLAGGEAFPDCGGLALFVGTVRDHHDGKPVTGLTYSAYAPLAERQIREIEREVAEKHGAAQPRVVHRVGSLTIGGLAIICVARAAHRGEAFAACREAVDRVKHEVPIWKEEFYADGSSAFVEGCCIRPDAEEQTEPARKHHPHHHHGAHG